MIDLLWWERAACAGMDPAVFFPARGDHEAFSAAVRVCRRCPVRVQCLVENVGERDGVWGATSAKERREMRRGMRAALAEVAGAA